MQEKKRRFYWVDVVKVIGIFLVFYAHILQRTYRSSTDAIFFQYKLIYAFHMPLFFFLSGFFFKKVKDSKLTEIGIVFQKRIFPVFLFGGISLLIWLPYMQLKFGAIDYSFLLSGVLSYLKGQPLLNGTVWFLVCLFTTEIWAVLLLSKIKTVFQGVLISSFFLYFGYILTAVPEIEAFFILPKNFWYLHESFLAFGFFSMGYSTFRWLRKIAAINPIWRIALILLFAWLTAWSVHLNSPSKDYVVVMKASMHGNLYFFISAFSGILTTVLIASLIPKFKWIEYLGKNTLILLGTNGFFMSFFNSHAISWLGHQESTFWVTFNALWLSVLTIGLSVPMIEVLNKWVPQLLGKPQIEGPILKAISPPQFLFLREKFDLLSEKLGNIKD